jgi:hypothetical protein
MIQEDLYLELELYISWYLDFLKLSKDKIKREDLLKIYKNSELILDKSTYIRFVYLEFYLESKYTNYKKIIKEINNFKKFKFLYLQGNNFWKLKIKWNYNKIKFVK